MRLTMIMMLVFVLQLSANSFAQKEKVSLNFKEASIEKIFKEIKRQTNYDFFYSSKYLDISQKISININDEYLQDILINILGNKYNIDFRKEIIVITPVEKESLQIKKTTIKGIVTDENGHPLPGVSVIVKGASVGTSTDVIGHFKFEVPEITKSTVLVFSFIGMKTQELNVYGKDNINVVLVEDKKQLEEVVITGYQVIDKRELTSAISTVSSEDLEKVGVLTVDQMLEGKATGLMVSNISTTPGAAAKIRVRSGGTFTGTREPLWVIDGVVYENPVPLSASEINSLDNVNLIGNAITGINPEDIAAINILKDASATAIYGTRAANGVIVITTRRGKIGAPRLSFSTSMSFVDRPRYLNFDLMNSKERIDVSREIYEKNLGFSTDIFPDNIGYEGALRNLWNGTYNYSQFKDRVNYLETLNEDWFDALYRPAINKKYSVNISGGADNIKYYFSVGYDDQQGTEKGIDLNRITARANLDINLRENVLLTVGISGSSQDAKYNHSSVNVFNTAYNMSRAIPVYNPDGSLFYQKRYSFDKTQPFIFGDYNILHEMDNSEKNITNKSFDLNGSLKWDIVNGLTFRSNISYRNTTNLTEEWIDENTFFISKLRTYQDYEDLREDIVDRYATVPFGGLYSGGMTSQKSYTITNQLNYRKMLDDVHVFNLNIGQEASSTMYWGSNGWLSPGYNHRQGRSFIALPDLPNMSNPENIVEYQYKKMLEWLTQDGARDIYPSITDKTNNRMSFFAIFNYSYDNRYVFNFNMRSDGSNTFGQYEKYKFKPTWSTSARWNIHNEDFMSNITEVDELSLRLSYGFRGTMPNASPYLTIKDYGRNNIYFYPENISKLVDFPNANLTWEKTSTTNIGLNYSVFEGRISGALDYAYSQSEDLLLSRPISLVNGDNTQQYNAGSKEDHSFEFNIRTLNIKTSNFSWSSFLNMSYTKERVLDGFDESVSGTTINDFINGSIYMSGFPIDGFFSYQFDGLNEKGEPTFKNLVDESNGSVINHLQDVLVYEGNRLPKYYGGFGTEFKYKAFTLSANFSYKIGHKIRLLNLYGTSQNMPNPYDNMNSVFNNRWRNPGDEEYTNIPGLSNSTLTLTAEEKDGRILASNSAYIVPTGKSGWWMYDNSDARTASGSHIRWQSLTLGYNVPKNVINKTGMKSARLGFQMTNIAVWAFDKKLKGQDPEQVRNVGMPSLPSYNVSLRVGF